METKNTIIGTIVFITSLAGMWVSGFFVGEGIGANKQLNKDISMLKEVEGELRDIIDTVGIDADSNKTEE